MAEKQYSTAAKKMFHKICDAIGIPPTDRKIRKLVVTIELGEPVIVERTGFAPNEIGK